MKGTSHDHRVSVRELAALLRVSTDTIRRAYRRGDLPAIRVKTALRFDLEEVHRVMQRQTEAYRSARRCAASGARRMPIEPQPPPSQTGALFPDNES
jgi:excisionase family DNA binding protein